MAADKFNLSALVLNKHWVPISTVASKRAVTLLYCGDAGALCSETLQVHDFDSWISNAPKELPSIATTKIRVPIPEVVVLSRYTGMPLPNMAYSRRGIFRRDGRKCSYCSRSFAPSELTIDHVIPASRGGITNWENCVVACRSCNNKKADRTPQEAEMRLRRKPSKPKWPPFLGTAPTRRPKLWKMFVKHQN